MRESVNRSQIDLKKCEKTFISRHILHQHWHTCPIALPLRRNSQHRSLLTVVWANSGPPFQPLRHQRNICHPVVNRLNRKTFLTNISCTESLCPQKRTTERYSSVVHFNHGRRFDYWNKPLNMRMRVCYLYCCEGGLCCYLVIQTENVLRPLQLFYFHLWPTYWLALVSCELKTA
jgi:hypothetical protein